MKYSCTQVVLLLFSVVLLCDAVDKFWCKFTENGRHAYGFYCNTTSVDMEQQHQNHFNSTNCAPISHAPPNVTFVSQLKFHKCDFDFILQQCKSAAYLSAIDVSHSGYDRLSLDANPFTGLKVLNASNNNLTTIDGFTALIHLQSIDLSGNQIRTLEPLQNNRQLQIIRAIENPISTFDCDHFAKMNTISVAISWNRIKKLNLACKRSTAPLRVISNGTAELVVLHHSVLSQANDSEIHCTAGSMTHIESCTIVGRNRLRNITQLLACFGANIKRLTLSGIALNQTTLTSTLQRFTQLEWLNLKDVALGEFDVRTIQHQINLMRLDLSQNHLSELKNPSLLLRFSLLREFKISGNQIQNVPEIVAHLRESLKWLDLADNFVGMVNASMFQRLGGLTTLKLSNTSLVIAGDQNPFAALKNLSILDISQNDLSAVDFGHLASTLGQLTRFSAANCHLTNATNVIRYFGEQQQLLELDLSGNDFAGEKFTIDTFQRLTKLHHLHLDDANLETFDFDWLQFNRELRAVKLSDNKLQSMKMATALVNLTRLHLDGNELINLDGLKRSMTPQLDYLAIAGNRLPCKYLFQLQQSFAGVKFIGDPLLHQKHGENCILRTNQTRIGMAERKLYAIGLLVAVVAMSITMILMTWFCCCRKRKLTRSEETLNRIRQNMRDSEYFVPNFRIPDDDDEHYDLDDCQNGSNDVYDEISLQKYHEYDRLHFDTDPMPVDDDNDENYLHIGLINGQIASRNVTNRL